MFQNPTMKKNPFQNGFPGQGTPQGKPFQDGGFMPQGKPFQGGGFMPQGMPFQNHEMAMPEQAQGQMPMNAPMQMDPFQRSKLQAMMQQFPGQGKKGAQMGG